MMSKASAEEMNEVAPEIALRNGSNTSATTAVQSFATAVGVPAQLGILSSLCSAAALTVNKSTIDAKNNTTVITGNLGNTKINRKSSPTERLQRSRERNRMHARKTRQRKKEHLMNLQNRADHLKKEQLRIRQVINEKQTASILVGLFSTNESVLDTEEEDPKIEELLRRPLESIPDASKIPELPALILPGKHNSRKRKSLHTEESQSTTIMQPLPDDGIDYQLLGKDRSKCTPAELDQIRRERNRMHAKRTRDRKRLFMEEMEEVIKKLEAENALLQNHLNSLGGEAATTPSSSKPALVSTKSSTRSCPKEQACHTVKNSDTTSKENVTKDTSNNVKEETSMKMPKQKQQFVTQLKSLLLAASVFDQPKAESAPQSTATTVTTAVSSTANTSANSSFTEDISENRSFKRSRTTTCIPQSITTSPANS